MSIRHHSLFYYGLEVGLHNRYINFTEEGGNEKTAVLPVGSYTHTKLMQVAAAALNAAGALDWAVTLNRSTRVVTISSSGSAELLGLSGSNATESALPLLGFNLLNYSGAIFTGAHRCGKEYRPQFLLQDYRDKTQSRRLINPTVNKSTSKQKVSVQHFGVEEFYKFNIRLITNNNVGGSSKWLRNNPNAVEEAKEFLNWVMTKSIIEFMPNEMTPNVFDRMYLDTSAQDGDGVGFELQEYVSSDLPEVYETGLMVFTVVKTE